MNILLVYPEFPETFWSFKHALNFVGKRATNPPLGLLTVASMLPTAWSKRLIDMNVEHLNNDVIEWADIVMISAMEIQKISARAVIRRCKQRGKTIIAGGPLFTMEPDAFPEVDHMVLDEAEISLIEFLNDFSHDKPARIYRAKKYPSLHESPIPMWELLNLKYYDSMAIQFSRGCPFNCDFCNVTVLLGHTPRTKSSRQLINELDALYAKGWRRNIFFVDDNFIGNKKILKQEVLPALINWRKGKTGCLFLTETSINLADDPELLHSMVEAGFRSVFVGIETPSPESLIECNKSQNQNRDLLASVRIIQRAGIQVMGGFIVGFDHDQMDVFQRQLDFIQQSGIVTAMEGILQAPKGTKLYERLLLENRILAEISGDNGDGTTNIITRLPGEIVKAGFVDLINRLYMPKNFYERVRILLETLPGDVNHVTLQIMEMLAFFKAIIKLGIFGEERFEFFRLLGWTLRKKPQQFPLAVTMSIYGYHFRKVAQKRASEAKQIKVANIKGRRYISLPAGSQGPGV